MRFYLKQQHFPFSLIDESSTFATRTDAVYTSLETWLSQQFIQRLSSGEWTREIQEGGRRNALRTRRREAKSRPWCQVRRKLFIWLFFYIFIFCLTLSAIIFECKEKGFWSCSIWEWKNEIAVLLSRNYNALSAGIFTVFGLY